MHVINSHTKTFGNSWATGCVGISLLCTGPTAQAVTRHRTEDIQGVTRPKERRLCRVSPVVQTIPRLVTRRSIITLLEGPTVPKAFAPSFSNTTGIYNTATGLNALYSNTIGRYNVADGFNALYSNTTGANNAAIGSQSLLHNTTGNYNTATGTVALYSNTTGQYNTADGCQALYHNTTASTNNAIGFQALFSSTTATANIANGYQALFSNVDGYSNTATGYKALYANTAYRNNAVGASALLENTDGHYNNAVGVGALSDNTTGVGNNAVGDDALDTNTTGSNNVAIGDLAGDNLTTGDGNVCIGASVGGIAGESDTTRIRNIGATPQDTSIYVTLDVVGGSKLGYVALTSSRRYKDEIKPMDKSSEALFALKPVNFRYKPEINPDRAERFGLIAEEVEKINPDLVSYDSGGKPITVRYESVNAMLLNEFLKEHRKKSRN